MLERSKFNFNTNINTNDKILTLSSCYTSDGIRVVLHAKLIKKEILLEAFNLIPPVFCEQ